MMLKILALSDRKKNEIFMITLCIILYLTRTSIPFFKYPFVLFYGILGIYILTKYYDNILKAIKNMVNIFPVVLLLLLYLIVAFFLSDKIYLITVKDIINTIVLLSIMLVMSVIITGTNELKYFYKIFLNLFIAFALFISLERIYNFLYASSYSDLYNELYLKLNKAVVDRNFAMLPVFFGMAGILSIIFNKVSRLRILIYSVILFIFSISFLLSGSRRGVFLFLIVFFALLAVKIWTLLSNNQKFLQFGKNIRLYIFSFILFLIVSVLIIFNTSVYFKNALLEFAGVKNISHTKNLFAITIYRYIHFLDKDMDEDRIYSILWRPVFDPKDPEAWWGNGNYKITRNFSGKNVEIVPEGSKGYLLDNSCLGDASEYHSYYFNSVKEVSVNKGDSLVASAYCYVSEDFDGDAVALRLDGQLLGNADKYYDLEKKGYWQKLIVPVSCLKGDVKVYLYMNKGGVKDFSFLKGHVIFAYTDILLIPHENSSVNQSLMHNSQGNDPITCNKPEESKKIFYAGLNVLNLRHLFIQAIPESDTDPIRNWIKKIVAEDTIYNGYKSDLICQKSIDNLGDDRFLLWNFAFEIFNKEYSVPQKIFGGGFNFLNWYGYCFNGDKTSTDYPHNPFLHILLYSGIFGLLFYVILLFQVVCYFIRFVKNYPLFFIFFIATFFFTFFSGGCPFDPPVMGFLTMLPFLINYVEKSDKNNHDNVIPLNDQNTDYRGQ